MYWLIDLGAVILIALLTYLGFKKGFVKSLIGLVGFILAFVLATSLSKPVSEVVYDNFISDAVKSYVGSYIGNLTGQADLGGSQTLYMAAPGAKASVSYEDLLSQVQQNGASLTSSQKAALTKEIEQGASVDEIVSQYNKSTGAKVDASDVADALGVSKDSSVTEAAGKAASDSGSILGIDVGKIVSNVIKDSVDVDAISNDVVDKTIRPMVVNILASIIFIVLFIIFALLIALLSGAISKLINKVPLVGPANKVLGGLFGFAKGLGWTAIILIVITMLAKGSDNATFREAADRSLGCTLVESWVPDFTVK